jgi:hypothetical protein
MERFVSALVLVISMVSCAPVVVPAGIVTSTPTRPATFSDPFAYCASVGTADVPDARYTGPKVPDTVARGIMKATHASADAPLNVFVNNSFWRCMGGKVFACTVGANLPCQAKADTNRTPSSAEVDFCKANASSDFIPAAVTGRETVYQWRCANGAPEVVKQVLQPDARGFISDFWYEISPG